MISCITHETTTVNSEFLPPTVGLVAISGQLDHSSRRGRLLIAEDDQAIRNLLRAVLSKHWDVEAVADGQEALDSLRRGKPDLVLTDITMPHMDGLELIRQLRADLSNRQLPVIVMSARANEESRLECFNAGADDFLPKPFNGRELVSRIRLAIGLPRCT